MPVATEVDVKQEIVTKEELDELRRRLEEFRNKQSNTPSGEALLGKPYGLARRDRRLGSIS
jgi:hypothetical protein